MSDYAYCSDFPDAPRCCDSCHDDMDTGYGDDLFFDLVDGREARVCCAVMRWLDDHQRLA